MRKCLLLIPVFLLLWHQEVNAQSKLERFIDRCYQIIEGDSSRHRNAYFFLIPFWDLTPETGIKVGLSTGYIFRTDLGKPTRPSLVRLNTSYTQYGQFNIRPTIDIFTKGDLYNFKAQYVYNDFNEKYWGVGNDVGSRYEVYDFKQQKVNVRATRQFLNHVYAGLQLQYERIYSIRFPDSSLFPVSGVSGIGSYETFGGGLCIAYDNRDNIYFPLKGAYMEVSNTWNSSAWIGNKDFHNLTLDIRKYHSLWKENVLAIQFFSALNFGDVPYRQMGTMGNEMLMRGYYNGRFRDRHLAAFQAEFRKKIWGPVGMVVFGGAGNVSNMEGDLFSKLKPNFGIGLRGLLIRKEHLNLRLDFGFGESGIKGVYFTMGEAF